RNRNPSLASFRDNHPMTHIFRSTILGIFLLAIFSSIANPAFAAPPNVVFVLCDDLGYGDLGCYGHPTIATPRLDQMAAEGQRWTSFYSPASVCSPARAGYLTGRYPIRASCAGVNRRRVFFDNCPNGMPTDEVTIAEMLRDAGYATMCVGKWHLGHQPEYLPTNQGFDQYFGIPYSNDMDAARPRPPYFDLSRTSWDKSIDPALYNVPLIESNEALKYEVVERPVQQETLTKRLTEKAVSFIKGNADKPFFLYVAHPQPHIPLFASKPYRGKSRRGLFGDVLNELDDSIGSILDALKSSGVDDNTLVIFTSDNGPWATFNYHGGSQGPLNGSKGTSWEGGFRVPAIFRMPGKIPAGSIVRDMGCGLDLLPTIANLTGATLPKDRVIDGVNLSETLLSNAPSARKEFVFYNGREVWAARQGSWKLHLETARPKGPMKHDPPILFQVDVDPSEKYNINGHAPEAMEALPKLIEKHVLEMKPGPDLMKAIDEEARIK
ncbi:MAG: sulfatase, partial [Planctomycetota bacterium]